MKFFYELWYDGKEEYYNTPFIIETTLTKSQMNKVVRRMKKIREVYQDQADFDTEIIRELILRTNYENYWNGLAHDPKYKEIEIEGVIEY